jgi:hypothetical protein
MDVNGHFNFAEKVRLGRSQSRSGHGGEEKNHNPRQDSNPNSSVIHQVA